ncbi:unnamed protein product [Boreogadus saida]
MGWSHSLSKYLHRPCSLAMALSCNGPPVSLKVSPCILAYGSRLPVLLGYCSIAGNLATGSSHACLAKALPAALSYGSSLQPGYGSPCSLAKALPAAWLRLSLQPG